MNASPRCTITHPTFIRLLNHQPGAIGLITLLRANLDNEILCWRVPRALRELAIKDEEARQQVLSSTVTWDHVTVIGYHVI